MAKHKNNHGLGRLHKPDERDKGFLIRSILPKEIVLDHKYWGTNGWWGNQYKTPMCVGYSLAHWLEDGPIGHSGTPPIVKPEDIYYNAQKLDEWEGEDYQGTSVRAGAKYLQQKGFIESYHWAWDLETTINAVLTLGPVVLGINWYDDMFFPDSNGFIHIGGGIAGGHAIKMDGVSLKYKKARLKQSWGKKWGLNGLCYISLEELGQLIADNGEVMVAIEADPIEPII